jgi:hypothetical protein
MKATIYIGNCLQVLKTFEENSVDAVVCDPPYGYNFMGQKWDRLGDTSADYTNLDKPHSSQESYPMNKSRGRPISETDGLAQQRWHLRWAQESIRVLKPGGFILCFGGDRTYHRLACAVEDAGFEIRGSVMWLHSQGFPKNLDVSKKLGQMAGAERPVVGVSERGSGPYQIKLDNHDKGDTGIGYMDGSGKVFDVTAPVTDAAKQWQGWGTALKPAVEIICMARKPLQGTVSANVLRWGVGALNIDGCRIQTGDSLGGGAEKETRADQKGNDGWTRPWMEDEQSRAAHAATVRANVEKAETLGRWPSNVILECICESTEVVDVRPSGSVSGEEPSEVTQDIFGKFNERKPFTAYPGKAVRHTNPECPCFMLDAQSGENASGAMKREVPAYEGESVTPLLRGISGPSNQHGDSGGASRFFQTVRGDEPSAERTYEENGSTNFAMKPGARRIDEGSASRFFYTSKADRSERNIGHGYEQEDGVRVTNTHPT